MQSAYRQRTRRHSNRYPRARQEVKQREQDQQAGHHDQEASEDFAIIPGLCPGFLGCPGVTGFRQPCFGSLPPGCLLALTARAGTGACGEATARSLSGACFTGAADPSGCPFPVCFSVGIAGCFPRLRSAPELLPAAGAGSEPDRLTGAGAGAGCCLTCVGLSVTGGSISASSISARPV